MHQHHSDHGHKQNNHDQHTGHSAVVFRRKFWLCFILTIVVLLYSENITNWLHITPPIFPGSAYIPLLLSSVIFFYGGWVFIGGALSELKNRQPGMMALISLAIIVSYVYSLATTLGLPGEGFFWELASLVTIMLLGHWIEGVSISRAEGSLNDLAKLLPDKAERVVDGKLRSTLVTALKVNDLVLVRPGANIPVDGIVADGSSTVDESAFTGESKPIAKSVTDKVIAGTLNQDGVLTIQVTKLGQDTILAGVMRLVKEAQASTSNTQVLANRAAFWLTIIALLSSAITFAYWFFTKDGLFALERAVTVLIIACPHALGLAIPLVVAISTALASKNGLLVCKRLALESARNVDIVLFDKTGTLTKGRHGVVDVFVMGAYKKVEIIKLAASLEQASEHFIGQGIVGYAKQQKIKPYKVAGFLALPGIGVQGRVKGKKYMITNYQYLKQQGLDLADNLKQKTNQAARQGKTVVFLVADKKVMGALALADIIRPESKQAIQVLRQMGIRSVMITGDSEGVASYVAQQLELDSYFAEVMPQEKVNKVKELQANSNHVAMVGDGINDAPALTQANTGIAIGAGTDIAIKSADIILINSNPLDVVKVIHLSRTTYRKMVQNLAWATGYNIVAIPLAAGVLYSAGILLSPAIGAILMSVSTVVVAVNAQLLRRVRLR